MRAFFLLIVFCSLFSITTIAQNYPCLPANVKVSDISSAYMGMRAGKPRPIRITVKQALKQIRARCAKRRLVDGVGREIRFYYLKGCWGNPPADHIEILERQRKEIAALKKRYRVIEMTCNPSGIPIP